MNSALLGILALGCLFGARGSGVAADTPAGHQRDSSEKSAVTQGRATVPCQLAISTGGTQIQQEGISAKKGRFDGALFEGVQIETADITLYELFFETILKAQRVQTMEHPQVDRLRSYCYRDVLIVVRQDLKTARLTGWVQINYAVPDVVAVQQELEQSYRTSPVAQRDETERSKIVRFRLKQDVRRGDCRAARLEVGGPEGFMIGFDQFKAGSCKTNEPQTETHH